MSRESRGSHHASSWHFSRVVGVALCGADDRNQGLTEVARHVNCQKCKHLIADLLTDLDKAVAETTARIRELVNALPDEVTRIEVLRAVMENRCPKCFDYSESGNFWCCYDSRGD